MFNEEGNAFNTFLLENLVFYSKKSIKTHIGDLFCLLLWFKASR